MLDIRYSLTRLYRPATDTRQAVELMGAAVNVASFSSTSPKCMAQKVTGLTAAGTALSSQQASVMPDIGILTSTDLLAIDQASVDLIYALCPAQRHDPVERMESREGLYQLTMMENLGIGRRTDELIDVS